MKKINNFENVKSNDDFQSLMPGGYIVKIMNVKDVQDKEYLEVSYDIAEGDYKDYYRGLYEQFNFWGGKLYRSYKEKALSMFKGFITNVEKSNPRFRWAWDEQALKGCLVGIVLQEEEYIPQGGTYAGQVRTRLIVSKVIEVDKIRKGDFKVPEKKKIKVDAVANLYGAEMSYSMIDDDDIQFD